MSLSAQFHPLTRNMQGNRALSRAALRAIDPEAARANARFYAIAATLDLRYAPATWAEVFADLPYVAEIDHVAVADPHHRSETFEGLSDVRLGAHLFPLSGRRLTLGLTAGLSLPTGRRHRLPGALAFVDEDEAAKLGVRVPPHSHLELGLGVVAPFVGADLLVRLGQSWMLYASGEATFPTYAASDGYLTAPSGTAEIGPIYQVGHPRLLLALFAEVYVAGIDHLRGAPIPTKREVLPGRFRVPNTGRVELAINPTITWWPTTALSFALRVRVPVFTRADVFPVFAGARGSNVQLVEPVGVQLGVAYDFQIGPSR